VTDTLPDDSPEVLIVGAGAVGLTLAVSLGQRGIRCQLAERMPEQGILPRMDLTNARSMEIFGRLGLAEKIRDIGWPLDARFNVFAGRSLTEDPYTMLSYPSILEARERSAACTDGSQPREPCERISQYNLEADPGQIAAFEIAAGRCDIPLKVLRIEDRADLKSVYGAPMLLVRPDLHVAWRGESADSADAILAFTSGQPLPHPSSPPGERS
jgi:hypothetical protein